MNKVTTLKIPTVLTTGIESPLYLNFTEDVESGDTIYSRTNIYDKRFPGDLSSIVHLDLSNELKHALHENLTGFNFDIVEQIFNDKYIIYYRKDHVTWRFYNYIEFLKHSLHLNVDIIEYNQISNDKDKENYLGNKGNFKPYIWDEYSNENNYDIKHTPGTYPFYSSGYYYQNDNSIELRYVNNQYTDNLLGFFEYQIYNINNFDFKLNKFKNVDDTFRTYQLKIDLFKYHDDVRVRVELLTRLQSNPEIRIALNNLLSNVEIPTYFNIKAKLQGYPNNLLPNILPCILYKNDEVLKNIELYKSNGYQLKELVQSDFNYSVKLDTNKINKKFLERTRIEPPTISEDGLTYQLNLVCTNSDPYPDDSNPGGGDNGNIPNPGETINGVEIPTPPAINVSDTGLITLYSPTKSQIKELARVLWKPNFFEKISKMFVNPMDAILGLTQLPIDVGAFGSQEVVVGNVGTGITMNKCSQQYIFKTVGTIEIPQKYKSFLDYSPFTKGQIFLPFIGFRPLNIDEVMNDTITITYQIDILSGACCATLLNSKGLMFANYSGNCATNIALSGRDFTNTIRSALSIATSTGVAIATAGSGLPATAGISATASAIGSAGSVAGSVATSKPTIERSGSCSGSMSMLTTRTPYVIIERPNACIPANQNSIDGYPAFITERLGDCKGLTSVYSCNLFNLTNATEQEKTEILELLKGGVII